MLFSDFFNIDPAMIKDYGAVDISLICDIPLFVDPLLIFNSKKSEYAILHQEIIRYFHFLATKAKNGLTPSEIKAWFSFNEIKQNWLGYSMSGNSGLALGIKFSDFLYENIPFALTNNGIQHGEHIEKVMLLYEGSGKDKISDLTVNLIKKYLLDYTQTFARAYLNSDRCEVFSVDKAFFNYDTESFVNIEYYLPFIVDEFGRGDFVLLTPLDILREDEPSISRENLYQCHSRIRQSIDNAVLRAQVENYIAMAIFRYEESHQNKRRKISEATYGKLEIGAFKQLVSDFPEIYDYYIRLREGDTEEVVLACMAEVNAQFTKLILNAKAIINASIDYHLNESETAQQEAQSRIRFFKHIIEDCDAYRNFYVNGKQIAKENDLQRMFKLVWYDTTYKADFETNNGRGPADIIVSRGQSNQCIVEFKLASNKSLAHVFTQVKVYEAANCSDGSIIVIFYFSETEYEKTLKIVRVAGMDYTIGSGIFLIDCRNDNKPSASTA